MNRGVLPAAGKQIVTERPNILLILTEQHRGDCLGCEGHPVLLTPTLDNLAAHGVRFSRAYSPSPTCIAARRTLLSGQAPARHGLVGYRDGVAWDPPPTLPGILSENGYHTAWIGRSHHQTPKRRRFGYQEMETGSGGHGEDYVEWLRDHAPADSGGFFGGGVMHNDWTARPWPLDEHLHATNWTVERGLRFLRRRDPSGPFFLTLSFIAAHPPLQPPAFYLERYLRTGVPDPVLGDWARPPDPNVPGDRVAPVRVDLRGEALLSARAAYYGLINHIDDQLRRIINPVVGLMPANTIIVFTSDHGEMLGDHYLWKKGLAYEPSARVPFLFAGPEEFGLNGGGAVLDHPVTLADIMPTLLELAGLEIPDTVDGHSLVPLMQGRETERRPFVHLEHQPGFQALTDGREKFIWFPEDGREQYFDLASDPGERHDLIGDESLKKRIAEWRRRLVVHLEGRPEGFSDGERLLPGRPCSPTLPHAGTQTAFERQHFQVF